MNSDLDILTQILAAAKLVGEYSEGDRIGGDGQYSSYHKVTHHKFVTFRRPGQPSVQFKFDIDGNLQGLETF